MLTVLITEWLDYRCFYVFFTICIFQMFYNKLILLSCLKKSAIRKSRLGIQTIPLFPCLLSLSFNKKGESMRKELIENERLKM